MPYKSDAQRKAIWAKRNAGKVSIKKLKPIKGITNKQYRKVIKENPSLEKKVPLFKDSDGDGKVNAFDCKPFDAKKQDDDLERGRKEYDESERRNAIPGAGVSGEEAEDLMFKVFKKK